MLLTSCRLLLSPALALAAITTHLARRAEARLEADGFPVTSAFNDMSLHSFRDVPCDVFARVKAAAALAAPQPATALMQAASC